MVRVWEFGSKTMQMVCQIGPFAAEVAELQFAPCEDTLLLAAGFADGTVGIYRPRDTLSLNEKWYFE